MLVKVPNDKSMVTTDTLDKNLCDEVMAEEIQSRKNPYYEAIEILEEFKVIDDWSAVYMPQLHDAIDTLIKAVKEAYNDM